MQGPAGGENKKRRRIPKQEMHQRALSGQWPPRWEPGWFACWLADQSGNCVIKGQKVWGKKSRKVKSSVCTCFSECVYLWCHGYLRRGTLRKYERKLGWWQMMLWEEIRDRHLNQMATFCLTLLLTSFSKYSNLCCLNKRAFPSFCCCCAFQNSCNVTKSELPCDSFWTCCSTHRTSTAT